MIADLGFAATLSRQLARLTVLRGATRERGDEVFSFERVYAPVAALVAAIVWIMAETIATRWLQLSVLSVAEVTTAIRWMGVAIAAQLQMSLYYGGLMGLERQALANVIQVGANILRNLGAVLILWKFSPTVSSFAEWQAFANVVSMLVARATLMSAVKPAGQSYSPTFSWASIRESLHYTGGMAGMAILSVILTQTDKLFASRLLPLETLGLYTIASSVALVPLMLATPISSAIIPRVTGLVALNERGQLAALYHRGAQLISLAILPAAVVLLAFMEQVVALWMGRAAEAELIGPSARFLLLGQLIQAISLMPYCLTLGFGDVSLNLRFALASVFLLVPLSYALLLKVGMAGGGIAWLAMNLLTIPLYCRFVHGRFLPEEFKRWLAEDVGKALLVASALALALPRLLSIPEGRLAGGAVLAAIWLGVSLIIAGMLPVIRAWIVGKLAVFRS